jgi:hypothetical protein
LPRIAPERLNEETSMIDMHARPIAPREPAAV